RFDRGASTAPHRRALRPRRDVRRRRPRHRRGARTGVVVPQGALRRGAGAVFGAVLLAAATLGVPAASAADRVWRIGWLDQSQPPADADAPNNLKPFL